jgi:type IV secretion system protein VirB10
MKAHYQRIQLLLLAGLCAFGSVHAQEPTGPITPPATAATTSAPPPASRLADTQPNPSASATAAQIIVPTGTTLPLVLHNAITTRNAMPGDPVFLETVFPILVDTHIVIPAGSYVQGEILEAKRPGKVKGRGEVRMRLNTIIMPNGYSVKFGAVPSNAGTGGNESTDKEGNISGDSDKASDVGTVIKGTAIGAGIGAVAARSAGGAGIGAGIGAAVGLAAVMLTRGPELELPRGSTLNAVLDRPLYLDSTKANFTDPGRASELPGPPSREPARSRGPF